MDFGRWEGLRWDDVDRAALDQWAADPLHFRPPGGESASMLLERVAAFVADRAWQPLVIVTHGGVIRAMLALQDGDPAAMLRPPPAPGSMTPLPGVCNLRPSTTQQPESRATTNARAPVVSPSSTSESGALPCPSSMPTCR